MIKVKNLCKSYKSRCVLSDINLHVKRGEIFGIVGQSGKVIVNDTDITQLNETSMRGFRRKIGMIFQNFALLNRKTVIDNVTGLRPK